MSDSQVLEYVKDGIKQGKEQKQLASELARKGVTKEQAMRVKQLYEQQNNVNASNATGTDVNESRLREEMKENTSDMLEDHPSTQDLARGNQVFGRNIFNTRNLTFEPSVNLATPSNYRLGPGDEVIIDIWGASQNTIEYGVNYMNIYALGTIFVELTLGMNAFITAQGFAKTGMMSVLIGAVANIILDPIFIFGFDMDVRGAALATIISQGLSCIWVVSFLCGKKTFLKIRKKNLILVPRFILPCLALGVSTFVMQASESVISVCFNSSLQKYGGDIAVGAMTILTSVMQFAMLPLQGLGQGAQPIISYNYGAGNAARVQSAFKLLLKVSLCYSVILWLLVMLLPGGFAAMFTTDAALMEFTKTALRIYMGAMFLFGIQVSCQMTFNALGKAVESIVVAVMRKFVLLLPLIYIMPRIFSSDPTTGVYTAEPIADVIAVTFTAILFSIQFKKALSKMKKQC